MSTPLSGTGPDVLSTVFYKLLGVLAVALAMNAFPRVTLLSFGAVPLLVTLLATTKRYPNITLSGM